MKTLPFDPGGDVVGGALREGIDATKQSLVTRLLVHKGEWFLNNTLGVNYAGVYRNSRDPDAAMVPVRREILAHRDVQLINNAVVSRDSANRSMEFRARVLTNQGLINIALAL